jgi:YVTN family beta-propeller protein
MIAALLLATTLSTGAQLQPAGRIIDLGNLPLSMTLTPERDRAVVVLSGYQKPGVQIVDLAAGNVLQDIPLNAAFIGAAFSPDGKTLYISGGFDDVVHVYTWENKQATFARDINLKLTDKKGERFPAGIAVSRDGKLLYVAENVADDIAVIDTASSTVVARVKSGHYPYAIEVASNGDVFVSAWGGNSVSVIRDNTEVKRIEVGRHPSALRINRNRLYVALASVDQIAVVDTKSLTRVETIDDRDGAREGVTPNAIAFSSDGKRMYVAEADANSVAVFDIATRKRLGRIPAGWYPSGVIATNDRLYILNSKGRGSTPNPRATHPGAKKDDNTYTLSLVKGTISVVDLPVKYAEPARPAKRVAHYPPFKHVIYIIKENRTYDQVLGDMTEGDGDPSLVFFGRDVSPNHHALAERFGLFDRFFTSGEVSQQGHYWSTAAYVTDYTEKITQPLYSRKREDVEKDDDTDEPAEGYLWTRAAQKKIRQIVYGEFGDPTLTKNGYGPAKPSVGPFLSPDYPPFDMAIPDQRRVDVWMRDFSSQLTTSSLPALEIMHLPCDHTSGARAGKPTPRTYMADNDLALARIVSAISKTRYWRDTVIFVVEDDAQDGPDHVDSHRSVMLAISAYSRKGVHHRFTNTTDVVATVEQILGLAPMSTFDTYARPLDDVFDSNPDLTPYEPIIPAIPHETNPENTPAAKKSALLDFSKPDAADENEVNHILWSVIKGDDVPYPGAQHASTLMWLFGGP